MSGFPQPGAPAPGTALLPANNLDDVDSVQAARTNLALPLAAATFGVAATNPDNTVDMRAALAALTINSELELPEGILLFKTSAATVLSLSALSGVMLRGLGRGTILRFEAATCTTFLSISGCAQFTTDGVQIQVTNAAVCTNPILYTCPVNGGSHDGAFRDLKIVNPSKAYRQINDVFTIAASAVITSGSAVFAAGDVGGGIGIATPSGVFTSTVSSVATLSNTLSGNITASQTNIPMTGAIAGAPAGGYTVMVGTELMLVTAGGTTATLTVTRGYAQTTAATALAGAAVSTYQATLANNAPDTMTVPYPAQLQTPGSSIMTNGFALATDQASGALDIPDTNFFGVDIEGALGAAWNLGGGVAGNILGTYMTGCQASSSTIGVLMNGSMMSWLGGQVGENGIDFKVTVPTSQPLIIKGDRSEVSGMYYEWVGSSTAAGTTVAIENFSALQFQSPTGVPIRHINSAPLSLKDGIVTRPTAGATVSIQANGTVSNPLYYQASNIAYNGGNPSPHPSAGITLSRSITPGPRLTGAGNTAVPASYPAVMDAGISSGYGVTNGRSGSATLTGGTVTIANTSVTASTLVRTWVQTLGTVLTPQVLYPSARTPGTSLTITSANATDTSTFYYELVEPF